MMVLLRIGRNKSGIQAGAESISRKTVLMHIFEILRELGVLEVKQSANL